MTRLHYGPLPEADLGELADEGGWQPMYEPDPQRFVLYASVLSMALALLYTRWRLPGADR